MSLDNNVTLSVETETHPSADFRVRAYTVARRTRARTRLEAGPSGWPFWEARTKGGDRVCSDNQGRLA